MLNSKKSDSGLEEYANTDINKDKLIRLRNMIIDKYGVRKRYVTVSNHIPEESLTVRNIHTEVCYVRGRSIFYKIEADYITFPYVATLIDGVLEGDEGAIKKLVHLDAVESPLVPWCVLSELQELSNSFTKCDIDDLNTKREILERILEELSVAQDTTAQLYESLKLYIGVELKGRIKFHPKQTI